MCIQNGHSLANFALSLVKQDWLKNRDEMANKDGSINSNCPNDQGCTTSVTPVTDPHPLRHTATRVLARIVKIVKSGGAKARRRQNDAEATWCAAGKTMRTRQRASYANIYNLTTQRVQNV